MCKIHLEPSVQDCQCDNLVAAYLRLDPPTGRLLLHFLGCSISPDCRQRFFANRSFRIEDDFPLPIPVMDALNLGGHSFYLERGDYPLLEDDHFLTVSLRLGSTAALGVPQRMAA
ncbi:hypothetical protein [Lewinella sp. W8]|uniref:hypothetical protein n=1 Tax=Lewinella sp. W8 TaxID=2528208 RepID=UPI001067874A|nr:hypothetical protein [Lewinella sp. W8]MTB50705.1 hypothetical protein [Lewinella sp. W8]